MYLIVFEHEKDENFVEIIKIFSAKSTAENFLKSFNLRTEGRLACIKERVFDNYKIPQMQYYFKKNDIFKSKDEEGDTIYLKVLEIDGKSVLYSFLKPLYTGIFNLSTFYTRYTKVVEFNLWCKYMEKVEEVPFLEGFYFNWDSGRFDKVVIK